MSILKVTDPDVIFLIIDSRCKDENKHVWNVNLNCSVSLVNCSVVVAFHEARIHDKASVRY